MAAIPARSPATRRIGWCILLAGAAAAATGCGDAGPVALTVVARVEVTPPADTLDVSQTLQLTATPRDSTGAAAAGWTVAWASSDSTTARVSAAGLVTALAPGTATITATAGGKSGSCAVLVRTLSTDIAIVNAQFTQAAQAQDGTIPLVLNGNGAALNVLLASTRAVATPMQLVLRLADTSGALVRSDTAIVQAVSGPAPGFANPSAQFFLPAAALRGGLRWEVVRDPQGRVPDDTAANDRFPRNGPVPVATVSVPTLNLRFIPIVLAAHGNSTGQVSAADPSPYLRTLLSVHPMGARTVTVGPPLTTSASFGTAPSGGEAAFWIQVLSELDVARQADPTNSDAHWIGVVAPPAGFNFTVFGGFGYIPASYADVGPQTRSAVLVNVGWFFRESQSRDLVAHELGHNFGRRHAPCGGAASPDPSFPYPGGTIGVAGHDVYSRSSGLSGSIATVAADAGDIMGYCFPVWSSPYTYQGVLDFRGVSAAAAPRGTVGGAAVPVLVVRGVIDGEAVTIEPAIVIDARPALPGRAGPWTLEGYAEDGGTLFRYGFEPGRFDHSAARPFSVAIPLTDRIAGSLQAIAVTGPGGGPRRTLVRAAPAAAPALPRGGEAPSAGREADGTVRVVCPDPATRALAVQDRVSGALLGSGSGTAMRVMARTGTPLTVSCSDGLRTARSALVSP